MNNTLYYGDNLQILKKYIPDNSVDLIYLDPPFNSKATYNVLFKEPSGKPSRAQVTAFEDTWHWTEEVSLALQELTTSKSFSPAIKETMIAFKKIVGFRNDMMAYLTMMCVRLNELKRVLKDTGSIYLHCDPTASHYLKILLDAVFGGEHFKNEIIWHYAWGVHTDKRWNKKHDIIFFYTKSNQWNFNAYEVMDKRQDEVLRRLATGVSSATMAADKSKCSDKTLKLPNDVWYIPTINAMAKERLGYPTQKPIALLERIIKASSNEGDVVLDPFCGCGTTVVAAQSLGRKWIGIDITHLATTLIKKRLFDMWGLEAKKEYNIIGEPEDLESAKTLALQNRYQFQWWAISLINAQPYQDKKKGADTGIDGLDYFIGAGGEFKKVITQVKSGVIGPALIRDLAHVVDREKAALGIFITLKEPTSKMKEEAANCGFYKLKQKSYPKIQIITIAELLEGKSVEMPLSYSGFRRAIKRKHRSEQKGFEI